MTLKLRYGSDYGSSGEFWTMNESLIQRNRVSEEGYLTVKLKKTKKMILFNKSPNKLRASSCGNTWGASINWYSFGVKALVGESSRCFLNSTGST